MSGCSTTQLSTIYRGDSREFTVEVKNGAGSPINLTGQTVTLTLAKTKQGTPVCTIANSSHYDAGNMSVLRGSYLEYVIS